MKSLIFVAIAAAAVFSCAAMGRAQTTQPATTQPATDPHDLPRIDGLVIDGKIDDWGDRGFRVDVLSPGEGWEPDLESFDPMLRLAWDERGLIVLATVVDDVASEAEKLEQLYRRDSVELFTAAPDGAKDLWQVVIAPGLDALRGGLRTKLFDQRKTEALKATPLEPQAAAAKTAKGYVVEALLPWKGLNIRPEIGTTIAFRANVNDADATTARSAMTWLEPVPGEWKERMPKLRLAEAAGESVTTGMAAFYDPSGPVVVECLATTRLGRFAVALGEDGKSVHSPLPVGRLWHHRTRTEIPKTDEPVVVNATAEQRTVGRLLLQKAAERRRFLLAHWPIRFQKTVFHEDAFPVVRVEHPEALRKALGEYTVETAFFDAAHAPVTAAVTHGRYGVIVHLRTREGEETMRFLTLYRTPKEVDWRNLKLPVELSLPAEFGVDPGITANQDRSVAELFKWSLVTQMEQNDAPAVWLAGMAEMEAGAAAVNWRTDPWARNEMWWYELKKKTGDLKRYEYLLHLPPGVQEGAGEKVPLVLFLHGSGERGDDVKKVAKHGPPKWVQAHPEFPAIVVSPQCPWGERWNVYQLRDLLEEMLAKYPVDRDRIYLTGLSMGGYGSWRLAAYFPESFAAVLPICAGGDETDVAMLRDIPVWTHHGMKDEVVGIEQSYRMVAALREQQARVRFTVDPEADHESWTKVYADPKSYEWLFAQRKNAPTQPRSTAPGTQPSE